MPGGAPARAFDQGPDPARPGPRTPGPPPSPGQAERIPVICITVPRSRRRRRPKKRTHSSIRQTSTSRALIAGKPAGAASSATGHPGPTPPRWPTESRSPSVNGAREPASKEDSAGEWNSATAPLRFRGKCLELGRTRSRRRAAGLVDGSLACAPLSMRHQRPPWRRVARSGLLPRWRLERRFPRGHGAWPSPAEQRLDRFPLCGLHERRRSCSARASDRPDPERRQDQLGGRQSSRGRPPSRCQ